MNILPIVIATACYFIVFVGNLRQKDWPHSLMWFSYTLANAGLLWYEWNKTKA